MSKYLVVVDGCPEQTYKTLEEARQSAYKYLVASIPCRIIEK